MACLLVPATEAVVTTIVRKVMVSKEQQTDTQSTEATLDHAEHSVTIPFTRKLKWLSNMLWGGSALLAFEHIWHGEITPFFPFLTGVAEGNAAGVLQEMATTGVSMAVLVTLVWTGMVAITNAMEKKEQSAAIAAKQDV
ncbi:hypothetical protein FACS1894111_11570 [Clostridia bacterium]|nr:hypothetical protein FACS1894111_11570 [Clostridia bacterium]